MTDTKVINIDSALEQLGDLDFYLELMDELILALPEKKDIISAAIKKGDDNELRLVSHSIKGVSANLHLPAVCAAAAELENAVKSANPSVYPALAEKLFAEFNNLITERSTIAV